MITLSGVSFAYTPQAPVLRDFTLEIASGLTLVLGPNGCGKSTLLKLIAGVERPSSGRIAIGDHDLWLDEVAARSHIAYLPEHPDLTPYATVHEVLGLVCGLRKRPNTDARNALEWAGVWQLRDRTVRELSKGERRRAVLAAARIGAPHHLILDEPLDAMDRRFRTKMVAWLGNRLDGGATVVLVSHEIEVFSDLADRAVVVRGEQPALTEKLPADARERLALLDELARS